MIVQEKYSETLMRTYSDQWYRILQNETGIVYDEAIDIIPVRYTYSETDTKIPVEDPTDEDYISAAKIMMGEVQDDDN